MSNSWRAASYLAPKLLWFYDAIGAALSRAIGIPVSLTQSQYDSLTDPAFHTDQVDLAFICGLPYARWARQHPRQFTVLAAPVMQSARYGDRPVYFADVIARDDLPVQSFADLRGRLFCYNEIVSNSGYNLLRGWMLDHGLTDGFFGGTVVSGGHQRSIEWVADGRADCAGIDSVVLDQALRDQPELAARVKVCLSIGPAPMPPILVATRLGDVTIDRMRAALWQPDPLLAEAMARAQVRRFARVAPETYHVLAEIRDAAIAAGFEIIR